QLKEMISAALAGVPLETSIERNVRRRVDNVFTVCAENPDLVRLVVLNVDQGSETMKQQYMADEERLLPMVRLFEQGMAAGLVRKGDARIMARLLTGLVSIALYQAFVTSDGNDLETYREACGDMIAAYMAPV